MYWPQARASQRPPDSQWFIWLILAGRGFGKTRTGAEFIRYRSLAVPGRRALVGPTFAHCRDVMLEGQSGLLSVLAPSELRGGTIDSAYNRSIGELYLANGSIIRAYSSERPRSLRGPNQIDAWGDEPAEWVDADRGVGDDTTLSNLLLGTRTGQDNRVILTGTPKRNRLIRELVAGQADVVTRGSTYENLDNLSASFRRAVLERYEGTRLARQELEAELLDDVAGALWSSEMFGLEGFRLRSVPTLSRVVVGVDPNVSDGATSDEMGIVVAGTSSQKRLVVLADRTMRGPVSQRAAAVVRAFHEFGADKIVVEVNNGGDWIPAVLRDLDPIAANAVQTVHASRGKLTRAEPIAQIYEQGQASHVGNLADLEDELTSWVPGGKSPNRLDALVWAGWALTGQQRDVRVW